MANSIKAIQSSIGSIKLARFIQARKIISLDINKSLNKNLEELREKIGKKEFDKLERRICAEYKIINTKGNIKRWC